MRTLIFLLFLSKIVALRAQNDSLPRQNLKDSAALRLNMDAVYNRPFLQFGKIPVAIGGYLETHGELAGTDGVNEGFSFSIPRLTLFLSSAPHRRVRFLTELEFEDGTKEINIEFASLDFEFHPLLNFRGGVVMNPIGAFNQNHDGPRWDFVNRPTASTQMLPATWSNVGAGLFGKTYRRRWVFAYEAYLTNGFDDQIIANSENRTSLAATKLNQDRFEESPNGVPLFTGKIAVRNRKIGEIGLSHMGGVFNKFQEDGLILDRRRRVDVWAIDWNSTLPGVETVLTGEWAWVAVDVPATYSQQFGSRQRGGFLDLVQPLLRRPFLDFQKSVFQIGLRLEYIDWNSGRFRENNQKIGDELWAFTTSFAWRPTAQTVLRLNYRLAWEWDFLGNPPARLGAFQLGLASYF